MTSCGSWMARRGSSFSQHNRTVAGTVVRKLYAIAFQVKPTKSFLHGFQTAQLQDELDKILFRTGLYGKSFRVKTLFHTAFLVFGNNGGLIRQAIVEIINLLLCQVVSFVLTQRTMTFLSKGLCLPKPYYSQGYHSTHKPLHGIVGFHLPKTVLLPCAGSTGHWPCLRIQSTISVSGKDFLYYTEDESTHNQSTPSMPGTVCVNSLVSIDWGWCP